MQTPNDIYKQIGRDIKWTDLMKPEAVTIGFCWETFAKFTMPTIPKDSVQYREMKKSFYAGFVECFKIMNDLSTELTEDQACTMLSKISNEGNQFFDELIKEHPIGGQR